MRRVIPIALWILVGVMLLAIWLRSWEVPPPLVVGRVFENVPWKHLPDVPRFQLTDQTGADFGSEQLDGRVYAVCFFFATCPSICRDLNRQVQRLNEQLSGVEISFLSITVDPDNDTPDVLHRYAADFAAQPPRWFFLTGPMHRIKELGEHVFRVEVIDKENHTDNILLVDKWGRWRDRFVWDDAWDMKRFVRVAREAAQETAVPWDRSFDTRNVLAGKPPMDWKSVPWIREFFLTRSDESSFYSRDLTGDVWIANFFFTNCTGICVPQGEYLSALSERLPDHRVKFVSLTTDPQTDTPQRLAEYARRRRADPVRWYFCTGDPLLIRRIGEEFFRAPISGDHHSSRLFVVDRWGRVRGDFDWQDGMEEARMMRLINDLLAETEPRTLVPAPRVAPTADGEDSF